VDTAKKFFASNSDIFLLKLGNLLRGLNLAKIIDVCNEDKKIGLSKSFVYCQDDKSGSLKNCQYMLRK